MKYISGEIIAHQLAVKLCELNGWPADYNSDHRTIAEIRFRESIERGIAAGKIKPHCPLTFTKLNLDKHLLEDATFSEQEVMDYLASEMADDARQPLVVAMQATIEHQQTKTPAPKYGHGCSDAQQKITHLTKYLELDTWTPEQAAFLVNGIDPSTVRDSPYGQSGTHAKSLAGAPINTANSMAFSHAARVLELWRSQNNPPSKVRPVEFVAWCKSKDISTEWITNAAEWTAYAFASERPETQKAASQDGTAALGKFLAGVGTALLYVKVAELEATKHLQNSPVANDLLKRYAALQQEGKQNAPGAVMLDICAADPQAKTMHEGEAFNTLENQDLTEDVGAEQEQEVDPADAKFAKLFPPAAPAALESMFPADGKWAEWAKRAGRNGLKATRQGCALFNPYLAAEWWLVKKKPKGWNSEKCLRVLAQNYPSETKDYHELLFPNTR